jgi:hypothetical protein
MIEIGGVSYEFPTEIGADVLEDCEDEINLLFELPERPRSIPLGKHAKAIRVLTARALAPAGAKEDDVKRALGTVPKLLAVVPLLVKALGFDMAKATPGEADGPAASTSG